VFKTTKEKYCSMLESLDIDLLPAVIRDAIAFCHAIGMRYLWVDSIYIVQDDIDDWAREAAKMAAVYGRSLLVLSATTSANASQGFIFNQEIKLKKPPIALPWHDPHSKTSGEIYVGRQCEGFARMGSASPLMKRGWALQERLMAPRMLHFGSQVFWECWELIRYEDARLDDEIFNTSRMYEDSKEGSWRRPPHHRVKDRWSKFLYWGWAVEEFSRRALTDPMDKLAAVQGVADALLDKYADDYYCGLWRSTLDLDLLWRSTAAMVRPPRYRAPSWSWAALDGAIETWRWLGRDQNRGEEDNKHFVRVELRLVQVSHRNPDLSMTSSFRPAEGTFLEVLAPMKDICYRRPGSFVGGGKLDEIMLSLYPNSTVPVTDDSPRPHKWDLWFDGPRSESGVYKLLRVNVEVVFWEERYWENDELHDWENILGLQYWALILQASSEHCLGSVPTYKRCGLAKLRLRPDDLSCSAVRDATEVSWTSHSDEDWEIQRVCLV
jgi:hypothetical protein